MARIILKALACGEVWKLWEALLQVAMNLDNVLSASDNEPTVTAVSFVISGYFML